MRYQLDFAPQFLLGSTIGILAMSEIAPWKNKLLGLISAILIVAGIVMHIFISLTGFRDTLRRGEPGLYYALEDAMRPISKLLSPWFQTNRVAILDITPQMGWVRFPDGSEGYPITQNGVQIRIHAPSGIRFQISKSINATPSNYLKNLNISVIKD